MLTRPELLFVLVAVFLYQTNDRPSRFRSIAIALAGFAAIVGPWLLFSFREFGTVIPNTVLVKAGGTQPLTVVRSLSAVSRILQFYVSSMGVLVVAMLTYPLLGRRLEGKPIGFHVAHVVLMISIPLIYLTIAVRGGEGITFRYAAPTIPVLILGGSLCFDRILSRYHSRKVLLVVLAFTVMSMSNISLSILHLPFLKTSVWYVESVLGGYGKWLNQNAAPNDTIACYDVGAIAYYSRRPVVDLIGLNSIEAFPLRHLSGPEGFKNWNALHKYRVRWFVTELYADGDRMVRQLDLPYRICLEEKVPDYLFSFSSRRIERPIYLLELLR